MQIVDILKKNSLPENYNENENAICQIEKSFKNQIETLANFPAIVSVFLYINGL